MPGTSPPRNVIYYNNTFKPNNDPASLTDIIGLPYTDVIIGFLIPDSNFNLTGSGGDLPSSGEFDNNFHAVIQALQNDGKNVLVSVGGQLGWRASEAGVVGAWQHYAGNVDGLVGQIVDTWVRQYGFNGVDIDFEDNSGFTDPSNLGAPAIWPGVQFLVALTNGLAQQLPPAKNIITHAPAPNYFYQNAGYNNAYTQIWQGAGSNITWINCQFYDNPAYDHPAETKVSSYNAIAGITTPQKLMLGAGVAAEALAISSTNPGTGYLPPDQLISQVIQPLRATWGPNFGGVMGWEYAYDDGTWAENIWPAISAALSTLYMAWRGEGDDVTLWWSSAVIGATTWGPQQSIPNAGTSYGPALASVGNTLYMAWRGEGDDVTLWWSAFDSQTQSWAPQQSIPNAGTSYGPALASVGNTLYMAWRGEGDDVTLWWSSAVIGATTWGPQQSIPNAGTSYGPALASVGNTLYMAWRGEGDDVTLWWSAFDSQTQSWAPQQSIPNAGTSYAPALASVGNTLYMAWRGEGDDVTLWWSSAVIGATTWGPQQSIPNAGTSYGPALASVGNTLYMAWRGEGDDVTLWWSAFDSQTQSWAPQQSVPNAGTSYAPALAT